MSRPNRELIAAQFSDGRSYARLYSGISSKAHLFSMRLKRVYELLDNPGQIRALDVGCGPGMPAEFFTTQGGEYFGFDLSEAMINECRTRLSGSASVHLSIGRMDELPFPSNAFDLVMCLGAIEYSEDAEPVIGEFARVLRTDGLLLLSMLNKHSPYAIWETQVYRGALLNRLSVLLKRGISREPCLKLIPEQEVIELLARNHLNSLDVVYYDFNLCLAPLDRAFPGLAISIARSLEFLCRSKLKALGTGFIVKATKVNAEMGQPMPTPQVCLP